MLECRLEQCSQRGIGLGRWIGQGFHQRRLDRLDLWIAEHLSKSLERGIGGGFDLGVGIVDDAGELGDDRG